MDYCVWDLYPVLNTYMVWLLFNLFIIYYVGQKDKQITPHIKLFKYSK